MAEENQFGRQHSAGRRYGERSSAHLVGQSSHMVALRAQIAQVAATEATILVTGPSGSGKENVARALHAQGASPDGPFVSVNCGAIPRDLAETELFGAEAGAYTGALAARVGKVEAANGGTLFLDEVGELPLDLQVKLLRVLEAREVTPVGSNVARPVRIRVVAATNVDLRAAMEERRFREDLYWRLAVVCLELPPLSERREDIPLLVEHFLSFHSRRPEVTMSGNMALQQYLWPGNVREVRNFVERSVALGEGILDHGAVQRLLPSRRHDHGQWLTGAVPGPMVSGRAPAPFLPDVSYKALAEGKALRTILRETEQALIVRALEETGGVVAASARILGIKRTTLVEKMKRIGIQAPADTDESLVC